MLAQVDDHRNDRRLLPGIHPPWLSQNVDFAKYRQYVRRLDEPANSQLPNAHRRHELECKILCRDNDTKYVKDFGPI